MATTSERPTAWARRGLAAVVGIAAIEWAMAAWAYRDPLDDEAWAALAAEVAEIPADEPVVLATEWLGPSARMHVDAIARREWLARADLRGWGRFHVVGLGVRWSAELASDSEDLPVAQLVDSREVGPFTVTTYEQSAAAAVLDDFAASLDGLEVSDGAGRCRGRGELRCPSGTLSIRTAEIDYRPRSCIALDAHDGAHVRIARSNAPTGDVVRGHVGFADFNARLRNDSPIALAVEIDGDIVARWTVTDEQGWWPFAVATEPGTHDVALVVDVGAGGKWNARGYDSNDPRTICIEARTMQEGA